MLHALKLLLQPILGEVQTQPIQDMPSLPASEPIPQPIYSMSTTIQEVCIPSSFVCVHRLMTRCSSRLQPILGAVNTLLVSEMPALPASEEIPKPIWSMSTTINEASTPLTQLPIVLACFLLATACLGQDSDRARP